MQRSDVLLRLNDPAPGFLCSNTRDRASSHRFRVPLKHSVLTHTYSDAPDLARGQSVLAGLPDIASIAQLRVVLSGGMGFGLFVSSELERRVNGGKIERSSHIIQSLAGAIVMFPPHEWDEVRSHMKDWFPEGLEAQFGSLPYSWDDIAPFAGINFSEDRWFVVLRGSLAGKVFWFTHDGECVMKEPWAEDVHRWGQRVWAELPSVLGGSIRYGADETIDEVPAGVQLRPDEFTADWRTQGN